MSDTSENDDRAPVAGADAPTKPEAGGPIIDSLMALFSEKGSGLPMRFLAHLAEHDRDTFDPDDVADTLLILDDADPELKKLRFLVRAGTLRFSGRYRQPSLDLARKAIRNGLDGSSFDDVSVPAAERLESVVACLASRLRENGPDGRRAFSELMLALEILGAGTALRSEQATPALRRAVGESDTLSGDGNVRRARIAGLSEPNMTADRLRGLLELLQPWEQSAAEDRRAALVAGERMRSAEAAVEEAATRVADLEALLRTQEAALEDARRECVELRNQVRDAGALGQSDVASVRARALSAFEGRIRPLLESARDAGELDPPRTKVMRRYIVDLLHDVDKEIEWLRSSG